MKTINLSEQNTVINQFLAEIRDKSYQRNRALFRNNIRRIGEMMAYEISKTLTYKPKSINTDRKSTTSELQSQRLIAYAV